MRIGALRVHVVVGKERDFCKLNLKTRNIIDIAGMSPFRPPDFALRSLVTLTCG